MAPMDMAREFSFQRAGAAFKIRHTGSRRRRVRLHYLWDELAISWRDSLQAAAFEISRSNPR